VVKADGGFIPIQNRPLQSSATPLDSNGGQPLEQAAANAVTARLRPDVQILQIDPRPAEDRGEVVKEQGKTHRPSLAGCDDHLGVRPWAKQRPAQAFLVSHDLVLEMLVVRELTDELQYQGDIGLDRRP
jgi:hypothetical protein